MLVLRFLVSGVLLTLATTVCAQQAPIGQVGAAAQANVDALVKGSAAMMPRGNAYGTMGSAYVDSRWLVGHMHMSSGVPLAPVPMKYDVLNRRLLMLQLNRRDSLLLDDQNLVSFELDVPGLGTQPASQRRFRRFVEAPVPAQRTEYVEVLHSGRYTLLKRFHRTLRKADYSVAYSTDKRYDEIEDKSVYFLVRPDKTLQAVKLTLKAMQTAAPELELALKSTPGAGQARTEVEWAAVLAAVDAR